MHQIDSGDVEVARAGQIGVEHRLGVAIEQRQGNGRTTDRTLADRFEAHLVGQRLLGHRRQRHVARDVQYRALGDLGDGVDVAVRHAEGKTGGGQLAAIAILGVGCAGRQGQGVAAERFHAQVATAGQLSAALHIHQRLAADTSVGGTEVERQLAVEQRNGAGAGVYQARGFGADVNVFDGIEHGRGVDLHLGIGIGDGHGDVGQQRGQFRPAARVEAQRGDDGAIGLQVGRPNALRGSIAEYADDVRPGLGVGPALLALELFELGLHLIAGEQAAQQRASDLRGAGGMQVDRATGDRALDVDGALGVGIAADLLVERCRDQGDIAGLGLVGGVPGIELGTGAEDNLGLAGVRGQHRLGFGAELGLHLGSQVVEGLGVARLETDVAECRQLNVAGLAGTRRTGDHFCIIGEGNRATAKRDIAAVLARGAGGDDARVALERDGLAAFNVYAAAALVGHQRRQLAADFDAVGGNDTNAAILADGACGVQHALGVYRCAENGGTRIERRTRLDHSRGGKQVDRARGVDLAPGFNTDLTCFAGPAAGAVPVATIEFGEEFGITPGPVALGLLVQQGHLLRVGCGHGEAADVHHATGAHHHAVRVGEDDVAAQFAAAEQTV